MKFQVQAAAIILLSITGVFAAPTPQDSPDAPDAPEAPAATSTSTAIASATATATGTASSAAAPAATNTNVPAPAAPAPAPAAAVTINLPYSVFDRVDFDPPLTRLSYGSTARIVRRGNPWFEAASADLFYVSSSAASGTCTLDFKLRSSLGAYVSGTGQTQVFTCNPVYNSNGGVSKCTRDQFIGTIQARVDGTSTFIPGQGRANGVFPCSYFAGKTVGIDLAAVGDSDTIYWKVGSGDGPYIRVAA